MQHSKAGISRDSHCCKKLNKWDISKKSICKQLWKKCNYLASITNGSRSGTVRIDRWRYTRWSEDAEPGNEELYDHYNDPEEHVNLADDPEKTDVLVEMRRPNQASILIFKQNPDHSFVQFRNIILMEQLD